MGSSLEEACSGRHMVDGGHLPQHATCVLGSDLVPVCVLPCPVSLSCAAVLYTGVGKMMWLIDFEGYSLRNAPAVRTSLGVLYTLQVRTVAGLTDSRVTECHSSSSQ
jgi:hypothetical protein